METASTQRRGVICPVLIVEGGSISGIVVHGGNLDSLTSSEVQMDLLQL